MLGDETWPADGVSDLQFQSFGDTNPVPKSMTSPPTDFFRLGPGDVVEIEILGEGDSISTVSVGPDGKIYYSLLPGIMVWGMTLSEAKMSLQKGLAEFVRVEPEVSVILRGVTSQRIWILGNVLAPGVYTLATPTTLLEVIALAGGMVRSEGSDEMVDLKNSFVLRDGKPISVDLYNLFHKGDLSQNIFLESGDYLYLRPAVSRDVYVLGAVFAPNAVPYNRSLTLVSAMASVGGPVRYAYQSHVAIVRGSLSDPAIATVDYHAMSKGAIPNVRLEPGDIVYVPLRPFYKLEILGEVILDEFVRTVAINEGNRAVLEDPPPISISAGSRGAP
jgi:protein involved in polysaccharide export with SLBB domain